MTTTTSCVRRALLAVVIGAGSLVAQAATPAAAAEVATVTCDEVPVSGAAPRAPLDSYVPQAPERIVDTRIGTGGVTGAVGAGCTLVIDTVPIAPAGGIGVALSVTVASSDPGFLTAFACDAGRPGTSSVNARPGLPTANLVIATPDDDGEVCLYSSAGGQVIVDVSGWWAPGGDAFAAIPPVRAFDTRTQLGGIRRPPGDVRAIGVVGGDVPAGATAVSVNLAAVDPASDGYLVVYPCGREVPLASNLNVAAGETRAVAAIVEIGVGGQVCVTGNVTTHHLLDVTGYHAPASETGPRVALTPVDDTRVVDTRVANVPGERFGAGDIRRFDLSRTIPRPGDAVAVVLNVVATRADRSGFVTVDPCGAAPGTSSLNHGLGQTANLVVTAVSPSAEVCVRTSSAVDVVIDLVGVYAGPPDSLLNELTITDDTGDGSAIVELDQPVFDPAATDLTVHCGPDGLDGRLRLGLAPGARARVDGAAVGGPGRSAIDTPIDVDADGLLTVSAQRGARTQVHHVRCLPMDFPRLDVERSGNAPGWYLTELGWATPGNGRFLAILDERGVPVWFKRTERKLVDAKLLSTGDLVASPISGTGFGVRADVGHRVFGLDGELVDVRFTDDPATYPVDQHDYVEIVRPGLVDGRAVISYPILRGQDVSALPRVDRFTGDPIDPRCRLGPGGADRSSRWVADGAIVETAAAATEPLAADEWIWSVREHFSYAEVTYPVCFENLPAAPAGSEIDAFHINSLQRVVEGGCEPECDYIVSARHLDAVFRVDRSSGDVEWILSSLPSEPTDPGHVPNASGAPRLRIVNDPLGGPLRMHDGRFIGGLLTMHDNRTGTDDPSRIVAYRIDPVARTATLVSQIDHPEGRTSNQLGSLRATPDGALLVGWGATQPIFVEYTRTGRELLRVVLPSGDVAYRIVKYAPSAFDAGELRAAAGGSVEAP